MRRPVFVVKRIPDRIVAIDRHRIRNLQIAQRLLHIRHISFSNAANPVRVNSDHSTSSIILIFLPPRLGIRNRDLRQLMQEYASRNRSPQSLPFELFGRKRRRKFTAHFTAPSRLGIGHLRGSNPDRRRCRFRSRPPRRYRHYSLRVHRRMKPINQPLLDARSTRQRQAPQNSCVPPKRNRQNANQHRHAQPAPNPLLRSQRSFHRRKHPIPRQQRQRQRSRSSGRERQ